MNKLYLLLFIALLNSGASHGQIYYQYFDGADTVFANSINIELDTNPQNVWQIGPPQKMIFDSASTLPNAIVTDTINYYPVSNTSIFRVRIENNFFPWGILAFQWNQMLDFGIDDGGYIEFSIDKGVTWQNAFNNPYVYSFYGYNISNYDTLSTGDYAFTGTDSIWRTVWLCFDLSWMNFNPDTLHFRFTMKSDSLSDEKEGWLMDNMMAYITGIHTVKQTDQKEYLIVYPNPSTGIVNVLAEKLMQYHIIEKMELIDPSGGTVKEWTNIPTKFWFETKGYPPGKYLLRIKTNIRTETLQLIVSKG